MPEAALDNWQPVWNAQVLISIPVCVNFELRPGAGDIHISWFNFHAVAQGNAYKPTKATAVHMYREQYTFLKGMEIRFPICWGPGLEIRHHLR